MARATRLKAPGLNYFTLALAIKLGFAAFIMHNDIVTLSPQSHTDYSTFLRFELERMRTILNYECVRILHEGHLHL